jgi:hypothetical protein
VSVPRPPRVRARAVADRRCGSGSPGPAGCRPGRRGVGCRRTSDPARRGCPRPGFHRSGFRRRHRSASVRTGCRPIPIPIPMPIPIPSGCRRPSAPHPTHHSLWHHHLQHRRHCLRRSRCGCRRHCAAVGCASLPTGSTPFRNHPRAIPPPGKRTIRRKLVGRRRRSSSEQCTAAHGRSRTTTPW